VHTTSHGDAVEAWMNQGAPTLAPPRSRGASAASLRALGLGSEDAHPRLEARRASTGLEYLIVPLRPGALERIRVDGPALSRALADAGAEFVYALAVGDEVEGRTWDRAGIGEDAATGSAAGPTAAFLIEQGHLAASATLELRQGRFVERPSLLRARMQAGEAWVGGEVRATGEGHLEIDG
jgi:PhzF family phenazine biosynthesis protein